jgi:hypothetical protein
VRGWMPKTRFRRIPAAFILTFNQSYIIILRPIFTISP